MTIWCTFFYNFYVKFLSKNMGATWQCYIHAQKVLSEGGPILTGFLVDEGEGGFKYHAKRAIIRPLVKRCLNGISLACQWWPNIEFWLGSFKIFQGIGTRNPNFIVIFQGGPDSLSPPPPPPHSVSAHDIQICVITRCVIKSLHCTMITSLLLLFQAVGLQMKYYI